MLVLLNLIVLMKNLNDNIMVLHYKLACFIFIFFRLNNNGFLRLCSWKFRGN